MKREKKYRCWRFDGSFKVVSNEDGTLWLLHDCYHFDDWSGLIDKHGNDVFEGDIVALWNNSLDTWDLYDPDDYETRNHPRVMQVKFVAPEFWFSGENDSFSGEPDFFEVIGNIHQNPDLLQNPETK